MKIVKKIKINDERSRIFFVGDLHGKYDQLLEKLNKVSFDFNVDHLFFVGDLIDRGPKVKELLDRFIIEKNFHSAIGNHENYLFNYETDDSWFTDPRTNSKDTIDQVGMENLKYYKRELLKKQALILEIEYDGKKFGVIHGGIPDGKNKPFDWNKIKRKAKKHNRYRMNLIWDRTTIKKIKNNEKLHNEKIKGIDYVFHGHETIKNYINIGNRYYIDTFGVSGDLTILEYDKKSKEFKI